MAPALGGPLPLLDPNIADLPLPEAGQWQESVSGGRMVYQPGYGTGKGLWPDSQPPLPWDAPPKGPKPFGVLHTTYSEVPRERFPSVPHHRVDRIQTEYNTKAKKLHDRADDGTNTTVMLANIPEGLTADECVDGLDQAGFFASYDYLKFRVGSLNPLTRIAALFRSLARAAGS